MIGEILKEWQRQIVGDYSKAWEQLKAAEAALSSRQRGALDRSKNIHKVLLAVLRGAHPDLPAPLKELADRWRFQHHSEDPKILNMLRAQEAYAALDESICILDGLVHQVGSCATKVVSSDL